MADVPNNAAQAAMLEIPPTIYYLRSLRNRPLGWVKALAELIDNAFDARANRVTITAHDRIVEVEDDGHGIKDLSAAVTSGKHLPGDATALGMWGVGLKDAWNWVGHRMEIETVHAGQRGYIVADSHEMERIGRWAIPAPFYEATTEPSGTRVVLHLSNAAPRRSKPRDTDASALAWTFTPALLDGRQVVMKSGRKAKPLKPVALPTLTDCVEDTFTVDGKAIDIHIGIVADGQSMMKGPFWIQYGHRNILSSAIGCANYSADRIGGIIKLGKGWLLSANKDDLTDYKEELADAIYERIQPMLVKAEQQTQDVVNDMLQTELESQINEAITKAKKQIKEKRPGEKTQTGAIASVGTGRRRRKAEAVDPTQEGSVDGLAAGDEGSPRRKRGVHLAFGSFETNETLGTYESVGNRVTLNRNHPFIAVAREAKNSVALYAIAFSLICHWAVNNRDNQKLLFEVDDFAGCYGQVLASLQFQEEAKHAEAAV